MLTLRRRDVDAMLTLGVCGHPCGAFEHHVRKPVHRVPHAARLCRPEGRRYHHPERQQLGGGAGGDADRTPVFFRGPRLALYDPLKRLALFSTTLFLSFFIKGRLILY